MRKHGVCRWQRSWEHSGYNPVELSRGAERLWGLYRLDLEEVDLCRVGRRSFWKAMVGLESGEGKSSWTCQGGFWDGWDRLDARVERLETNASKRGGVKERGARSEQLHLGLESSFAVPSKRPWEAAFLAQPCGLFDKQDTARVARCRWAGEYPVKGSASLS